MSWGNRERGGASYDGLNFSPGSVALVVAGVFCILLALYIGGVWPLSLLRPAPYQNPSLVEEFPTQRDVAVEEGNGNFYLSGERTLYESDQMRLLIPKLGVDVTIGNGVDEETLKAGPGLYDYAQMPGTGNNNVSIAGHRDVYGAHFYAVDTLQDGDFLYLIYNKTIYRYTYSSTTIVAANDWGPIYRQGFSCLTLTSCDPIGTTLNRIIIQAELSERVPDSPDYVFASALSS